MLEKRIEGHSSQTEVVDEILSRVRAMLMESRLEIKYNEYRDSITLEGKPFATGKNTIVIFCDKGDPDVDVMVDTRCCGR